MQQHNLDSWIKRMSKEEMPIFARTAQLITSIASNEDSSFADLARGILQDALLTSRILRLGNSVYYNPVRSSINTVSRAVMKLGFDTIYSMCISFALVESLLKGAHKDRVAKEMARSFHAAVQAKRFANIKKDRAPEEVFIAALLYRLGHVAFWCFAGEQAMKVETAMKKQGLSQGEAEQRVLGFRLHQLTKALSKEWNLSKLLETSLEPGASLDPRVNSIVLGQTVAVITEQGGWENAKVKLIAQKASELLKLPVEQVTEVMHASARDAAQIARHYGMGLSSRLIPIPGEGTDIEPEVLPEISEFPQPDRVLQLKILHELSSMMLDRQLDINLLFSVLMEGIFRGIGMDRVLFAILTPDRRVLMGRYGLGWAQESTVQRFSFLVKTETPSIFSHVLDAQQPVWVTGSPASEHSRLLTPEVKQFTSSPAFFIMPVVLKGVPLGVIYADRQPSGRELNEESFTSFRFLGQQANLCLSAISGAGT